VSVYRISPLPGRGSQYKKLLDSQSSLRWLAVVTDRFDAEADIATAGWDAGILPRPYFDFHPTNPFHLCRELKITSETRSPLHWICEATYSSEPLAINDQDEQNIQDPTLRPPKIKWQTNAYRKPIWADRYGNAIVNSAGDYFDPPIEVDVNRFSATINKNVAGIPIEIVEYDKAVNDSAFYIQGIYVGPYVARLASVEIGELATENEYYYFPFTCTLEFRSETWNVKPLQQGYNYKSGSERKVILDDSTPPRPVTSPRLLAEDGSLLDNPTPATAVYGDFEVYDPLDFSILPGFLELNG
jgi:hypothetical protein